MPNVAAGQKGKAETGPSHAMLFYYYIQLIHPNHYLCLPQQIKKKSPIKYRPIFVPEDNAANTIFINGHVICKSKEENPRSWAVLERECRHPLLGLSTSEIEKAVGSLTCMSLRFNRPEKVVAA